MYKRQVLKVGEQIPVKVLEEMCIRDRYESVDETEIAYAPLELLISLDSLEDSLQFISRNEFKRLQVIKPDQVSLTSRELERILYKFSETLQHKLQEQEET